MNNSTRFESIPHIVLTALPDAEREKSWHLITILSRLSQCIDDFEAALEIMQHSNEVVASSMSARTEKMLSQQFDEYRALMDRARRFSRWEFVGLRDATMTLSHFLATLKAINFNGMPFISKFVDHKKLRNARKEFETIFPDVIDMRNNVAHSGETITDKKRVNRHTIETGMNQHGFKVAEGNSIFIGQSITDGVFFSTQRGPHESKASVKSVRIDDNSLIQLNYIFKMVCAAIAPAEDATRELLRSKFDETGNPRSENAP
jgi:hypothetical protein